VAEKERAAKAANGAGLSLSGSFHNSPAACMSERRALRG